MMTANGNELDNEQGKAAMSYSQRLSFACAHFNETKFFFAESGLRTTITRIDKDADLRNYVDTHGGRFIATQTRELKYEKYEMVGCIIND
jgi:hypothetical protein